jgi:hypothetical protein
MVLNCIIYENNKRRKLCAYFYICVLFNETVHSSDYIASNDRMINENGKGHGKKR